MYNISRIEKIKAKIQKEIDDIIDSYTLEINEAVKLQLPKGHKLYSGMGSIHCENSKGEYVGEKFSRELTPLLYSDCFRTSIEIKNVNVEKK